MKKPLALIAIGILCAACSETTGSSGSSGGSSRDFGSGNDSKAGSVTANVRLRNNGSRLFVLNRGVATCTAVFDDAAVAGASELSPINCTDGNNGNATIRYDSDGSVRFVVYNAGLDGGGTINF